MNYELAKELKDAGFPQMGDGEALIPNGGDVVSCIPWCQYVLNPMGHNLKNEFGETVYSPTLSELIEACSDKFKALIFDRGDWIAYSTEPLPVPDPRGGIIGSISKTSPEEAVAKLWLILNKK